MEKFDGKLRQTEKKAYIHWQYEEVSHAGMPRQYTRLQLDL
jgi:hypothetical protein